MVGRLIRKKVSPRSRNLGAFVLREVAIIVKEKNGDGRYWVQLLDHVPGWKENSPDKKLEVGGNVVAIKEENFSLSRDSPHWIIDANSNLSILERICVDAELGQEDHCDKFCQNIWDGLFETIPTVPLTIDHGMRHRETAFKQMKGHKLFWLSMDAIQHHLIIEKCRGRYRVFQAYVCENDMGFTAREWCQFAQKNDGDDTTYPRLGPMHEKYGGGKTVGDKEIMDLLDQILQLQKLNRS
jgi:hypothetical protein